MKKLSKERYRFIRRYHQLILKRKRRRAKRKNESIRRLFPTKIPLSAQRLVAPAAFNIFEPAIRTIFLAFLRELRSFVLLKHQPVLIDFSSTKTMSTGGTLLFVAELRRIIRLTNNKIPIRCLPPRNTKAWQVLEQIGVLELLKCRKRVIPTDGDVVHWRFAWGNKVLGEEYDTILQHYDGKLTDGIAKGFYHGLTEAMTNSRQHAYIEPRQDGLHIFDEPTDWWMFSQEKDDMLTVVFCDLGIGIPATLPIKKPHLWQKLMTMFGQVTDGQAILEAIADSKSRTGKSYRGKGLKQLLEVISASEKGILTVLSNRGCYRYQSGLEFQQNYKDSILGTLIAWQIPITKL
ncbi:hypothetical protein [Methylomonas sp. ZR1]|uniref:hypothetical protein n=1 Tax=Methylomonas sp. ZR1 TaxID=1797072 RepID=UPI00149157C1|nr:hypothetical protein [Methylomonas sp. ZR1]NOV31464.1 hypothetical protein [Methylomonas sp. ZR1]